jgi:heme oxygenase
VNLLQRLKTETAFAHERIEQAFDLEARTSSQSAYRNLLARLYGFHAAWEPRAEAALADPGFFSGRRKVELLIADLRRLGMADGELSQLALCAPTVAMRTRADAFGSMYVIEGSTLGGVLIARHVERRLGLGFNNGCTYFRCYGDEVGPMWRAFGTALLAGCGSQDEHAVITGARRTFDVLHRWLCVP